MCLDTVTKTNLDESGVGWKVFVMREGKLCGDVFYAHYSRPVNKWLKASAFTIKKCKFKTEGYPLDFHIFKSKEGAQSWARAGKPMDRIMKVKYRKGHTRGKQLDYDTIVAKEMLILPNQYEN